MGLHSAYIVSYHTEYFIRIVLHILDWTVVGQLGVQKWMVGIAKGSLILGAILRSPFSIFLIMTGPAYSTV
jgi:hypothetical protein